MSESKWYYYESNHQKGPVSRQTIIELIESKIISPETLVWSEEMPGWKPVKAISDFTKIITAAPPPVYQVGIAVSNIQTPQDAQIKRTSVILTIIFTIITAGIYYPCWFITRRKQINSLRAKEKLGIGVFIFAIVVFSASILLNLAAGVLEGMGEQLNSPDFL